MELIAGCVRRVVRHTPLGLSVATIAMQPLIAHASLSEVSPGPGLSKSLAKDRTALLSDLHYGLEFALTKHGNTMAGHEVLRFTLKTAGAGKALALDYRDGTITSATLNGKTIATVWIDGHLLLRFDLASPRRRARV